MFLARYGSRRLWPAIFLSLLAVAAQLDARGVLAVVDSMLGDAATPSDRDRARSHPPAASPHATDADAILARNPFDSVTGGLLHQAQQPSRFGADNPWDAPDCEGMRVAAIAAFDDPASSLAAIASGQPSPRSYLRVRGGEVAGKRVLYIGMDRVWMSGGDGLCQTRMFKPAASTRPSDEGHRGVVQVGSSEFRVDRGLVDRVLENPVELMHQARIEPELDRGRVVGIRLQGVRPGTLLAAVGIHNGDRLERVNGFDITSPEKALEAYARLRTAEHLTLSITREGRPMTLDYEVQ
jgi:general secretion pathway protein C